MRPVDIRKYKNKLREDARKYRLSLTVQQKSNMDDMIKNNVARLLQYQNCSTLFIYVSTKIEVETCAIIEMALADGKKVAVPRCINGTRNMVFHFIN